MKQLYISPELEILLFLPAERLANDIEWQNDEVSSTEPVPDVTIPGSQIPGWGN